MMKPSLRIADDLTTSNSSLPGHSVKNRDVPLTTKVEQNIAQTLAVGVAQEDVAINTHLAQQEVHR